MIHFANQDRSRIDLGSSLDLPLAPSLRDGERRHSRPRVLQWRRYVQHAHLFFFARIRFSIWCSQRFLEIFSLADNSIGFFKSQKVTNVQNLECTNRSRRVVAIHYVIFNRFVDTAGNRSFKVVRCVVHCFCDFVEKR